MHFSSPAEVFRNSNLLDARLRGSAGDARETRSAASTLREPTEQLLAALGAPSISGAAVTDRTALGVSAAYACVDIISGGIAQLPLRVHRKTPEGSEEVQDHPAFRLLKAEPNPGSTAFHFKKTAAAILLLRGNSYARVNRDSFFDPESLTLPTDCYVEVLRLTGGGVAYRIDGQLLSRADVLHFRGLSLNGITGLSPIGVLRETFGQAIALQEFGSHTFRNGVRASGILQYPGILKPEAAKNIKQSFEVEYSGLKNSGKTMVLEEGMKWQQVSMTNEDAEYLASRSFSVAEIARIYRVPLHMLMETEKSTSWGTGIEQMQIGFVTFTLAPWLKNLEEEFDAVLLTEEEKATGYYTKFGIDALVRGDFKARVEAINLLLAAGVISINEARRLLDMNEIADATGGIHRVPLNTAPLGTSAPAQQSATA